MVSPAIAIDRKEPPVAGFQSLDVVMVLSFCCQIFFLTPSMQYIMSQRWQIATPSRFPEFARCHWDVKLKVLRDWLYNFESTPTPYITSPYGAACTKATEIVNLNKVNVIF
jgi:hypothetical protein